MEWKWFLVAAAHSAQVVHAGDDVHLLFYVSSHSNYMAL